MNFLNERQIADEVADLVANARDVRLAVAFWGNDAQKLLGGLRPSGGKKARVICNLESGACNPDELLRLRKTVSLKSHPQLHAKVYWTPDGVILGSSNASTNGLWGEGKESRGWREANLLIRDKAVIDKLGKWFNSLWREGIVASPSRIEATRPTWLSGKERAPTGGALPKTLFDAFRSYPKHPAWRRVKVAFVTEDLSPQGRAELNAERKRDDAIDHARAYEGWNGHFAAQDRIIDVDGIGAVPKVHVYRVGDRLHQTSTLTYLWEGDLDLAPFGPLRLSRAEKLAFGNVLPAALNATPGGEVDGGALWPLAKVFEVLLKS